MDELVKGGQGRGERDVVRDCSVITVAFVLMLVELVILGLVWR